MAKKTVKKKSAKAKKSKSKKLNTIQQEIYIGPKGLEDTSFLLDTMAAKAAERSLDEDLGQVQENAQVQTLKTGLPSNVSGLAIGAGIVLILVILAALV